MDYLTIELIRRDKESWGIELDREAPCFVEKVKSGSAADEAGIEKGDCIIGVNGVSTFDASYKDVNQLIANSGKIIRFKLVPHATGDHVASSSAQVEEDFWTNQEDPDQMCSLSKNMDLNSVPIYENDDAFDDFDLTDFVKYFQLFETNQHEQLHSTTPSADKKKSETEPTFTSRKDRLSKSKKEKRETSQPSPEDKIEQDQFVVTRENQKDFDENYVPECTFQGRKASVAGAYTGDHNQILGDDENDVRGVRSRVMAGIQHFSFEDEQVKIDTRDQGKIVIYSTSLGINRSLAQRCDQVRNIFKGFRVKFEDRDIFLSAEHKRDLFERLGLEDGAPFPELPRVYIDGVYVGGSEDVQAMSDCGDLRIRLKDYPKFNIRSRCPTCNAMGSVVCHSCKGNTLRSQNRFAVLKCSTCKQQGSLPCPDCL